MYAVRRFCSYAVKRPDLYGALGVARNASLADLKKAYFRKAQPLRLNAAATEFHLLSVAYRVLSDGEARAKYDAGGDDFRCDVDPDLLFEQLFGDAATEPSVAETPFGFGGALHVTADLSVEEAARGVPKTLQVPVACEGSRLRTVTLTVPVPEGVRDGETVRMIVDERETFVTYRIRASDYYRRDGLHVHSDCPVSIAQAALGGTVKVKGLYADHTLQVLPGTSSHTVICIPEKGMKKPNERGYGDHFVHIKINVPKELTSSQKTLLLAYARTEDRSSGHVFGIAHDTNEENISVENKESSYEEETGGLKERKTSFSQLLFDKLERSALISVAFIGGAALALYFHRRTQRELEYSYVQTHKDPVRLFGTFVPKLPERNIRIRID